MPIFLLPHTGFDQHSSFLSLMNQITHHLLHAVPADQSVRVSEVSLIILVINHHKLAAMQTKQGTIRFIKKKQVRVSHLLWCLEE